MYIHTEHVEYVKYLELVEYAEFVATFIECVESAECGDYGQCGDARLLSTPKPQSEEYAENAQRYNAIWRMRQCAE